MDKQAILAQLKDEETRVQAIDEIGEWAKNTCLLFGSNPTTAYQVALILVEGISASWEDRKPSYGIVR